MHAPSIRPPRKSTLTCAALCFVCALLSLGFVMLQNGGAFTIREDFDFQQLPFTMALHNQIARGGLDGWCWNLDLGTSAIQGFGFYELGSPFFWTSMLFSADAFPYVVGWMYILKYVVAGLTAHLLVRRFVSSPRVATVAALLYAFSGFQTTNLLFYHFHDVVALFPLLLIGLERLMARPRDFAPFALAVFANALVNYFFFVQSVVFLLLYFGFRFGPGLWRKGLGALLAAVGRCLALGVLGCGMAAALLVPSLLYMLGNPRSGSSVLSIENVLWEPRQLLFVIQGILLPADAMHNHNAVIAQQWTSTSCWLPMVGPSLCIAYLKRRLSERDWLALLVMALLVASASPLLNAGFILFTGIYQRWWYALVLMGALATARVLDDPREYDVRFGTTAYACLLVALVAAVLVCATAVDPTYLLHPEGFALYAAIAAAGCLATYLVVGVNRPAGLPQTTLVAIVAATAIVSTALTLHSYKQDLYQGEMLEHLAPQELCPTVEQISRGTQLEAIDPQYRYATGDNRLTLTGNAAGTSSFSSTISNAVGRFEEFFGWGSWNVWNLNKESVPGLSELVGGRYTVLPEPNGGNVVAHYQAGNANAYVTERKACPIGFICDRYAITDEVYQLDQGQRALALMQAPVVSPADEQGVSAFARRAGTEDLDLTRSVTDLVQDTQPRAVTDFWRSDHGYGFRATCSTPALVYLSVPHDDGWTAVVDGRPAKTVDSAGMTLLPLEAGKHTVEFSYETPGLRVGMAMSAVSWLVLAFVAVLAQRK